MLGFVSTRNFIYNIFTIFLQQIISGKLLPVIIIGQKNNFNGGLKIKSNK